MAVAQAVAEALICLEEHGIAHGDVRPENILIDNDGTPKLAELGFAIRQSEEETGDRFRYMAPELFTGQEPNTQSDLYSLGCTLYRCLSGKPPYDGEHKAELMEAHVAGNFPDARNYGASDALTDAIKGFVAVNPDKRYGGALKANLDLVRVMTGHPPDGPSGGGSARGSNTETFQPIRLEEGKNAIPEGAAPPFKVGCRRGTWSSRSTSSTRTW